MSKLTGRRVAMLATDGFEDSELTVPQEALIAEGATVEIVSPQTDSIEGKNGHQAEVTVVVSNARANDFDALVLPGGVVNGDQIRLDADAVSFTRDFFSQGKPVAAICHGGWILADADVLRGKKMTSYPSLKTDLRNAGAEWVDEEVVVDDGFVTSRTPDDLPAFTAKLIEEVAEGRHAGQTT